MYDLQELTAFASVMDTGSLAASARALGLPESTLSRHIRQLEYRLGQPLLRREANRMIPTAAGTLFHTYCSRILRLADEDWQLLPAGLALVPVRTSATPNHGLHRASAPGDTGGVAGRPALLRHE